MGLPKRKLSRSRGGKRRSHRALQAPTLSMCSQCKQPKTPHRVCPNCGYYAGRQVIAPKAEKDKS